MDSFNTAIRANFKRNFTVNVADFASWSIGIACVSTTTVLPLLVSHLTDNRVLIGLVPSLQFLGWRLPQMFTGHYVEKLPRKLPFILAYGLNERVPFIAIGIFMLFFVQSVSRELALAVLFVLLAWQAIGGGLIANAWQDMVAKVILPTHWGLFFGLGNAIGALLGIGGAAISGYLLANLSYPQNFAYSYLVASVFFMLSWLFLALTVEPPKEPKQSASSFSDYLRRLPAIVRNDVNFRRLIEVRSLGTFSSMGTAFLAVHAIQHYTLEDEAVATFTATMLVSGAVLNPILGRLGDRRGHKTMVEVSFWAQCFSMLIAAIAPTWTVFLASFALKAASDAIFLTSGMPIVFQFCSDDERPTYIGLANTLTAPPLIIAPLVGGMLANLIGYMPVFWVSAVLGAMTALLWRRAVSDPAKSDEALILSPSQES